MIQFFFNSLFGILGTALIALMLAFCIGLTLLFIYALATYPVGTIILSVVILGIIAGNS